MIFKKLFSLLLFTTISVHGFSQTDKLADVFEWQEMGEAIELAAENDKKVLVYANAVWCTYCKKMEKEVFSLEKVQQATNEDFYSVWIDIESEEELNFRGQKMSQIQFARIMRVTGTPTFIFFDSEGEIIAGQPGFIPEDMYLQILEFVGSDAYVDQSFGEFTQTTDEQ
jgi:thioredoxin-related protein